MSTNEAVAKRDVANTLQTITGRTIEELRLVAMTLLPKELQNDMQALALYIMRCRQLEVDPFGSGAYPVYMKGKFQVLVHYQTIMAKAYATGNIKSMTAECVYEGEKFSYDPQAGTVSHEINPEKRKGIPYGAWAKVERKDREAPFICFVTWEDSKRFANSADAAWNASAREMTRKAAIKDVLRMAFPEVMAGMYDAEDFKKDFEGEPTKARIHATPELESKLKALLVKSEHKGKSFSDFCAPYSADPNNLYEDEVLTMIGDLESKKEQGSLL